MDLDSLARTIRQITEEPGTLKLAEMLISWKNDNSNVKDLEATIERYIDKTLLANANDHSKIYRIWVQFRDEVIHGIGGMTMNERLYFFSLISRWDNAEKDTERKAIYAKLLAFP